MYLEIAGWVWFSPTMRVSVQLSLIATLGALLLTPAGAGAAITVQPAQPSLKGPLTVTWTAARAYPKGSLSVLGDTSLHPPKPPGCTTRIRTRIAGAVRRGQTVQVVLRPQRRWCRSSLTVGVFGRGDKPVAPVQHAVFREVPGIPVTLKVDSGSLTFQVPGRPDRVAALSGELRGWTPFADVVPPVVGGPLPITLTGGALTEQAPAPDPLCTSFGTFPRTITLAHDGRADLFSDGQTSIGIVIAGSRGPLSGCEGPQGFNDPNTATPLLLTGTEGWNTGPAPFTVTGTLPGITYRDRTAVTTRVSLTVHLELSSRL